MFRGFLTVRGLDFFREIFIGESIKMGQSRDGVGLPTTLALLLPIK